MKKKILGLCLIALFALTVVGAGCAQNKIANQNMSTQGNVANVSGNITLTFDFGDGKTESNTFNVAKEETVLDVLNQAKNEKGIAIEFKDNNYVEKVGDKKNGDGGLYWVYNINSQIAALGIAEQKVKGGDVIEFKFDKM